MVILFPQHLMFPNQENGRFSVSEDGTFRIRDVEYQDEGQYVCQALNVLGSEKATATIEVRGSSYFSACFNCHSCYIFIKSKAYHNMLKSYQKYFVRVKYFLNAHEDIQTFTC